MNRALPLALLAVMACVSLPLSAAGTVAGTSISNTATVDYRDAGNNPLSEADTEVIVVDEILDVALVSNDPGNVGVTSPDLDAALFFTVTNTGNGTEAFELVVVGVSDDDFTPENCRIYLDDGSGDHDPADPLYVFGSNNPLLPPDGTANVFIVCDIPADRADNEVGARRLRATSVTASATGNAPGTVFFNDGDMGVDAVVGLSTASALARGNYQVGQVTASLAKAQAVDDGSGGSSATAGAIVTYTLTLSVNGVGDIDNARITDAIPANTTYVPGSITLDSGGGPVALTDTGADADGGRLDTSVNPNRVDVTLGTVAAPATRVVTFQVTIN